MIVPVLFVVALVLVVAGLVGWAPLVPACAVALVLVIVAALLGSRRPL